MNALGAALLILAFQATSSPRVEVTDPATGKVIAACEGNARIYLGGELPTGLPTNPDGSLQCPPGIRRAVAVVETEWPKGAINFCFALMAAGAIWQILLIREPETAALSEKQ